MSLLFLQLKSNFYNETVTAKIFLLIQGGHVKKCKQILKINIKTTTSVIKAQQRWGQRNIYIDGVRE